MPQSHTFSARLMSIYYSLSQYPILSGRIRARMRKELFTRGVISPKTFEEQVRRLAIESQLREGLRNPYADEPGEVWEMRLNRVRDQHTDEVFSQHLSSELFEQLVKEVLHERGMDFERSLIGMNVELAPLDLVFEQAAAIERLPEDEREPYAARLEEIKVVLIRSMISDQLRYINVAKEWFTISDLTDIRMRKIGTGRIGGKSAGMLLAARILHNSADAAVRGCVNVPESYFIGADELYTFMSLNDLFHWNDQKYKTEKEMRAEFPKIQEDFERGQFPPDIVERLTEMLSNLGDRPLIVRSSSLLEDNFGTSFAGKYESIFLPNQRSLMENVEDMLRAVKRIYASTLNPNALLYRRSRGLQDYDERMAILIQAVQGESFGRYFMPEFAGVAFSRNLYRWAPQIRREDGFVRLVWGLGTRAVDRVGNDYPRLIALSHPTLRPSNDPRLVRRYSQQYVDVLDLQDNEFKTLPVHDVINTEYPALRFLAQLDEGGYYTTMHSRIVEDVNQLVLTFDGVLRRTPFADRMRGILSILEEAYRAPVDMEFTLQLQEPENTRSDLCLSILQCRPQAQILATEQVTLPSDLELRDVIFSTNFMVPQGRVDRIEYVLFVPPEGYFRLPTQNERALLARAVGTLNAALQERTFICVGPGRWGSSNSDLGVPIDYGDIYNASALVELAGQGIGLPPEPSLGTHFFQDLLEAQIYPLAIYLDDPQAGFNRDFFYSTPNRAGDWFHLEDALRDSLRLIRVADYRPGHHMRLVMSDEKGTAVAYLRPDRT